jgi:hypothetical protein
MGRARSMQLIPKLAADTRPGLTQSLRGKGYPGEDWAFEGYPRYLPADRVVTGADRRPSCPTWSQVRVHIDGRPLVYSLRPL